MIDIDGTLVQNAATALPSPRVTKAILDASKKVHVGLATGRPLFMIEHLLKALSFSGISIVNDGAQIIDVKTRQIYKEQEINRDDIPTIEDILLSENTPKIIMQDDQQDILFMNDFIPTKLFSMLALQLTEKQAEIIVEKIRAVPSLHAYKFDGWERGFGVNISHVSATKQHGILEVARILGINTHEIIGIGDSYNDFPLLMACGLKVAMGNALDDLKAIADYVAPSVSDDGVADVIERFILSA